jgi:hypothetical protein
MTHIVGYFSPVTAESAIVCVLIQASEGDQLCGSDKIKDLYHYINLESKDACYWGTSSGAILLYLTAGLAVFGEDVVNSIDYSH